MDLLDPRILVLTVVIASLMFAVVAFSRGRPRGALAAVAPVVPLVIFYDSIGARRGWWHYPSVEGGATHIAWYIAGGAVVRRGPWACRLARHSTLWDGWIGCLPCWTCVIRRDA